MCSVNKMGEGRMERGEETYHLDRRRGEEDSSCLVWGLRWYR